LGSASVIILDETVNIGWLVNKTVNFFKHESCGKCTPCREGTFWMNQITRRIAANQAADGDVELLGAVAGQIQNKCLCALGEFSIMAVLSGIKQFREDFDQVTGPE
jgi:NADH-quinone oxidoreductase subunit F